MPARFKVEITPAAEGDLEEIWTYISEDSPPRATHFIHELEKKTRTLERFPERCPLIPENEILGTPYRHLLVGKYRLIFRVADYVVYILRIVHGSRLLDNF